jgi:uncharacterized protein YcbX
MWTYVVIGACALLMVYFLVFQRKKRPVVVEIIIYPIKSCGAVSLNSVSINEYGMLFDREWVILTPDNNIVTQREDPSLLKLQPTLFTEGNEIKAIGLKFENNTFKFSPQKTGEIIPFICKSVQCEGIDEGDQVRSFLSKVLKKDYRLVRVFKHRQLNEHPRYKGLVPDDFKTTFHDSAQFLLLSEETFSKTKSSLPSEKQSFLEMIAFRGNIIVRGCSPFEEDTWARFTIGNIDFQGIARCPRCKITTVNQKTLEYDDNMEPVTTLRKINGNGTKGYLGMHCVRLNNGEIAVGQSVIVKKIDKFPDI